MTPVDYVTENLPLIIGVLVFVIFTAGLVLALRTASGRDALAGAAVRLALAMLALAERWLGQQMEPAAAGLGSVQNARNELRFWLALRAVESNKVTR